MAGDIGGGAGVPRREQRWGFTERGAGNPLTRLSAHGKHMFGEPGERLCPGRSCSAAFTLLGEPHPSKLPLSPSYPSHNSEKVEGAR